MSSQQTIPCTRFRTLLDRQRVAGQVPSISTQSASKALAIAYLVTCLQQNAGDQCFGDSLTLFPSDYTESAARIAIKPSAYDLKPGLTLVIVEASEKQNPAKKRPVVKLNWQMESKSKSLAIYDTNSSDGLSYVAAGQSEAGKIWIKCGRDHRKLTTLTIRAPGDVEVLHTVPIGLGNPSRLDQGIYQDVPIDVGRTFHAVNNYLHQRYFRRFGDEGQPLASCDCRAV